MAPVKAQVKKNQETVGRITAAALQAFAEHGFEGARIDEIAKRAAVNKAMIYYHIGDKQALYARALHGAFGDIAAQIAATVSRAQTPEKKLKAYIRSLAEIFQRYPLLPPIMMREFASGGRHLPEIVALDMLRILDTVSDILRQGCKQKVFIPTPPLVLHLMVVGTMTYLRTTQPVRQRFAGNSQAKTLAPASGNDRIPHAHVEKLVLRAIKR